MSQIGGVSFIKLKGSIDRLNACAGFLLGAYLLSLYVDTFTEDAEKVMIDSKSRKEEIA
jgi:hypothetical protein